MRIFTVNFFNKAPPPFKSACDPFIAVMFSSNILKLSAKPTSRYFILMTGSVLNKKKTQQVCFLTEKKLDGNGA